MYCKIYALIEKKKPNENNTNNEIPLINLYVFIFLILV